MKNLSILKIFFLLAILLSTTNNSFAQETSPLTTFGGSADLYYKYDFKNVDNSRTSFTNSHDSFEIGMASIEAAHKFGKASVFVDLGFGTRAAQFSYNDDETTFLIKQLNMTYEFSPSFKVTVGSFSTHLGYELVDAIDNKNYSMSYAFSYGPFFNTGVKAQYTSGKYSFMAGVTNPTDFKTAVSSKTNQKTFIGQIGYTAASGSAFLNFTTGSNNYNGNLGANTNLLADKNVTQIDFVGSKKVGEKLLLGFNGTYAMINDDTFSANDADWFALVGYLNYSYEKNFLLAYRLEYFDDKDGYILGSLYNSVIGNTVSLNLKEGNFTFIPEIRYDIAAEDSFSKKDLSPTKSTAYILLATTYSF